MAQLDGMNIKLVADVSGLRKGAAIAESSLQDIAKSATTTTQALDKLGAAQTNVTANLAKTAEQALKTDSALEQIKPGANQAAQSLTNLGRIAQDAPFGFIGIQNNISPLIESFGRLKAETGSTGGALKALASSLGGAAGFGLAVSLATSALTVLSQNGLLKFSSASAEAKKANEEFKKSLSEAAQGAIATGLKLQAFVDIAKNGQLPLKQRNEALKEANQILGLHGEKLTLANIATERITLQTQKYTQALIAQAVATKYADKISELTIKQTELQNKLKTDEATLAQQKAISAKEEINLNTGLTRSSGAVTAAQGFVNKSKSDLAAITLQLNTLQKDFNTNVAKSTGLLGELGTREKEKSGKTKTYIDVLAEFRKEVRGLQTELAQGLITPQAFDDKIVAKLTDTIGKLGELKAPLKVITGLRLEFNENIYRNAKNDFQKKLIDKQKEEPIDVPVEVKIEPNISDGSLTALAETLNRERLQKLIKQAGVTRLTPIGIDLPISIATSTKQLEAVYAAIKADIETRSQSLRQIIFDTSVSIFSGFGDAIAAGLSGANFGASLFSGLFQTLGAGLQAYGKQIIATSTLLKNLQAALKASNFGGSLIIGIGLVALGGLVKNLGSSLKLASGGYVNGAGTKTSDSIPAQLSKGEYVIKAAAVDKFGVGFLNSINSMQMPALPAVAVGQGASNINAGTGTVMVDGEFRISGDSLRLLLNRANQNYSRNT